MKYLFLMLSLFFVFIAFGQSLPDSGFTNKAEAKNEMLNGKKEGKWVEYLDTNEDIINDSIAEGFFLLTVYKADTPNGLVREYRNVDGTLFRKVPYVNGKINGVARIYFKSGTLFGEFPFKDSVNNTSESTGLQKH